MLICQKCKKDLQKLSSKKRAETSKWFFKTGPGEYGHGDVFIGVNNPGMRQVAKKHYQNISLAETEKLLHDKIHEYRQTALFILVYKYEKADEAEQKKIYNFYLKNTKYINNWDLVDLSAPNIVGKYLAKHPKEKKILYKLVESPDLWEKRISILATYTFIRKNDFSDTLKLVEILIKDKHDLIHKAIGWMLREVGKRNSVVEEKFLQKYYKVIPRTALRYAIEKFPEAKRISYLKK